jgi:hypothetical protein
MTYVLEKITPNDMEEIMALTDARQRMFLKNRRFFEDNLDSVRAIDREQGYYLMNAPSQEDRTTTSFFFFHFKGHLFNLAVAGYSGKPVKLIDRPAVSDMKLFQEELTKAFAVHCLSGLPDIEPPFVPTFENEGN